MINLRNLFISVFLLLQLTIAAAGFELSKESVISLQEQKDDSAAQTILQNAGTFLSSHLAQMTGMQIPVQTVGQAPKTGIYLLTVPQALQAVPKQSGDLERFTIEGDGQVLRISSPTAIGVQHGVMVFLRDQGCRWLMPSPKWWIIPQKATVSFTGKRESAPSYASRRIWYAYGFGTMPELRNWYTVWAQTNLLGGARAFNVGHSYGNIIGRNTKEFAQHPEYYAQDKDGKVDPKKVAAAQKFCFSNPGLRELCLRDRLAFLKAERAQKPLSFMVSMDPSDGEGTCHCQNCAALGTTTDRVFSLANYVARGLREQMPGTWVGLYAYSSHRVPPTIQLEPNIHVEVAMAFNDTVLSYEELIRRWGEKAGSLGIREYYGVEAWDWGLPGRMRGGNVAYHRKMIPSLHQSGAVSINAETNANWGGQALGLYVASRLLWDHETNVDAVVDEYLTAAFGTAAPQMRKLYDLFETSPTLGTGGRARMFELAFAGLQATTDQACRARITDILAYLIYVDYYTRFQSQTDGTEDYFTALRELMTFAHRIEGRNVVHTYALARRLCNSNVKVRRPEFWLGGKTVIWKQGAPCTDEEIRTQAEALCASYAADLKERVSFSRDLVLVNNPPASTAQVQRTVGIRYRSTVYLQPLTDGEYAMTIKVAKGLQVTGSLYPHPTDNAVQTFKLTEAGEQPVSITLKAGQCYRLELATGKVTSIVTFPDGLAIALEASEEQPFWQDAGGPFLVVLPAKTSEIRCQGSPRLSLVSPSGKRTDVSEAMYKAGDEFARVPVVATESARAWLVGSQTRGKIAFLNIPPLIQLNRQYMLLPREVVKEFGAVKPTGK